ncbi:MAG: hypothetical protein ACXW2U_07770 [Telluria sp.]
MNNLHNKIDAASSAQFFGRFSFVRRFLMGCALVGAVASVAHAGPGDRDDQRAQRPEHQMPSPQERQDRQRQFDTRQFDSRSFEARAEEQRRNLQIQQEQNRSSNSDTRRGRLTADERRDLRRQINEAGIDLYPNAQRGR